MPIYKTFEKKTLNKEQLENLLEIKIMYFRETSPLTNTLRQSMFGLTEISCTNWRIDSLETKAFFGLLDCSITNQQMLTILMEILFMFRLTI